LESAADRYTIKIEIAGDEEIYTTYSGCRIDCHFARGSKNPQFFNLKQHYNHKTSEEVA
jgi:hypothetical protein